MGRIVKKCRVMGSRGKDDISVLFDNGGSNSLVRQDVAERLATIERAPMRLFVMANGMGSMPSVAGAILHIKVDGKVIQDDFYVVDKLREEIIVGADTMQRWDIHLHPRTHRVTVGVDPRDKGKIRYCKMCKILR